MYNPKTIESKWQKHWQDAKVFRTENPVTETDFKVPKYYTLDMFPYPSGVGLHVGHPKGFIASDIVSRYKHAKGFRVLHPMGWDSFGLPAENYAIKTGVHPKETTDINIANYKRQLQMLGLSYDWDREIATTDPKYYKWTQWIFLKLFEHGLAYEQDLPINYCPSCKTGLANEEVVGDNNCDRCGTRVERRKIRQWVLAITKYAERLLTDVDRLDWPEGIKDMQRNWIGKSEGVEFDLQKAEDPNQKISVYTTRIDTVYGMTYVVLAADHKEVNDWIVPEQKSVCEKYIAESKAKSDLERTNEGKEKTGVFTGSYVVNPFNGEQIPVWIGDYVLGSYGTGAVMAVPAHDERDFEFAKKMGLRVVESVSGGDTLPFTDDGILVCSAEFTGLSSAEARRKLAEKAESEGFGKKKTNYKLRDWLFSRQRYWGEPIPLIHIDIENLKKLPHITDISEATNPNLAYILKRAPISGEACTGATCGDKVRELVIGGKAVSKIYDGLYGKIICDYNLPLELPEVTGYEPAGDGNSPLALVPSFVDVKLADNLSGKRETNTMPQWAGSCWYYLRFMDPANDRFLVDPKLAEYWGEIDSYVGGAEHAVLHLLYARFWHKFLFDIGVVPTDEPFRQLHNQGMILAYAYERENGGLVANDCIEERNGKYYEIATQKEVKKIVAKMSKSLKNVVNPDSIVEEYGTDTFRLYEMYMADFKDSAPWNTEAIIGVRRFLDKSLAIFESPRFAADDMKAMKLLHKTIKKVGEDIEAFKFNTAIAALMILLNEGLPRDPENALEWKENFAILLHPFAPHLAEELWNMIGKTASVFEAGWPEYQEFMLIDDEVTIAIQVNGKLRGTHVFLNGVSQEEVALRVMEDPEITKWTEGLTIVREIFVPNKLYGIVAK